MEEAVRSCRLLRFGTFEVDFPAGELRKRGVRLKLTGQPFQVLTILLERPGEVVTREELQKRLWPDTFVDVDHNLNTAINKIREVLGDSAESPRYVETDELTGISRNGYVSPFLLACSSLAVGERDQALTWIERGYQDRDQWTIFLKTAAAMDPLRSEPRFQAVLRRMNFPQ